MGFKRVFLILTVSTITTRSQLQQFQPMFFRPPDNRPPGPRVFPGEPAFIPNMKNIPPLPPTDPRFLNFEHFIIPQDNNRGAMLPPGRDHHNIGPNNHIGGVYDFMAQLNQPYNQNNLFINTNPNVDTQPTESIKQKAELKTNVPKEIQQNNQELNADANKNKELNRVIGTINNQGPKTNEVTAQRRMNKTKTVRDQTPAPADNVTVDNKNQNGSNTDTGPDKKTVKTDENVYNGRPNNSSTAKPVLSNANPKAPASNAEGRTGTDNMEGDGDRWVWEGVEVTEVPPTTPDVDDRAAFDGDKCPSGKVKINNQCVIED